MIRGARLRRGVAGVLLGAPLLTALAVLSGCGAADVQFDVSLAATSSGSVKPGDTPEYTVTVVNRGPGAASGVTVRVDLPSSLAFKATTSVPGPASNIVRTQPQDPPARSLSPTWGTWIMPAPVVQADGTVRRAELDVSFTATVSGAPGDYGAIPRAFSDSGEGAGPPSKVTVVAASQLTVSLTAQQTSVKPGDSVDYRLTIANAGSGQAAGLSVLLTLPEGMQFDATESVRGNASRAAPEDPVKGSVLVRYGGWIIPAGSQAGPGLLTIIFRAKVLPQTAGGRYTVNGQVTDAAGMVLNIPNSALVTVVAPTPSPAPLPTATPQH